MSFAFVQTPIMLAAESPPLSLWLPAGLMTAGVVLLGVLVYLAMRDRAASRNFNAQVDSSAEELDRLKRAGDRAALLTAAAEKAADALDERVRDLEQLLVQADECIDQVQTGRKMPYHGTRSIQQRDVEPKRAAQTVNLDPLTLAVYDLADAGRTAVQIAGELHEHTGKIELILNLRRSVS